MTFTGGFEWLRSSSTSGSFYRPRTQIGRFLLRRSFEGVTWNHDCFVRKVRVQFFVLETARLAGASY